MERIKTLYNRLNVFGALLVSTLLPCFLATLLLAAVFLPMMNRTARSSDSAYARVLLDAGANQFERIGESIAEATAVVEYSTWIHPLYLDMLEGTRPDYTVKKPDGRKNPGKYTVKVTMKGNYSGGDTGGSIISSIIFLRSRRRSRLSPPLPMTESNTCSIRRRSGTSPAADTRVRSIS